MVCSRAPAMRRGEVLGLRWPDVDLERARLSVQKALTSVAYKLDHADVRTDTGRRTIDLDPRTVAVLRGWRKRQLEERVLAGLRPEDAELVFAHPDGSPVHPDYFSQWFERQVAKSKLPRIRLHDLRHTHATILLKAGVPVKVVSERLGHAKRRLHDERLPARPPRHAGRCCRDLCRGRVREHVTRWTTRVGFPQSASRLGCSG